MYCLSDSRDTTCKTRGIDQPRSSEHEKRLQSGQLLPIVPALAALNAALRIPDALLGSPDVIAIELLDPSVGRISGLELRVSSHSQSQGLRALKSAGKHVNWAVEASPARCVFTCSVVLVGQLTPR